MKIGTNPINPETRLRHRTRTTGTGIALACVLLANLPFAAQAQNAPRAAFPADVEDVLQKMSAHLAAAKGLSLQAEILYDDLLDKGVLIQRSATLELETDRAEGLHAVLDTEGERRKFWIHDKLATVYDADENVFSITAVPKKIGPALDFLMAKHNVSLPLADFVRENPYQALSENVVHAIHAGFAKVEGVACHHLVFTQGSIDWQLWVEDSPRSLPRRVLITYKLLPGSPRYSATFSRIGLQTPLPAAAFKPTVPEVADQIHLLVIDVEAPQPSK